MWEEQVRCIVGKELDDICTNCQYIDAVKRHKQQLGAIEEYTQWLKKNHGHLIFFCSSCIPAFTIHFSPKSNNSCSLPVALTARNLMSPFGT